MARGGKRAGAGRKPGVVSQAKRDIAEMAKEHACAALGALVEIMGNGQEAASARVSAANAILDRAYGKPMQAVQLSGDEEAPAVAMTFDVRPAGGAVRVTKS